MRKNAVLCVPKVYEIEPNLIEENQMINKLKKILETDKNSIVLANTIIALSEINMLRPVKVRILTKNNLENVLVALNESVGMLGSSRVGAGLHT